MTSLFGRQATVAVAAAASMVCGLVALGWFYGGIESANQRALGQHWRATAASQPADYREQRVVLVDIDEETLATEGAWPWQRGKVAGLVNTLAEQKPAAIVLDLTFADKADPTQNATLEATLQQVANAGVPVVIGQLHGGLPANVRLGTWQHASLLGVNGVNGDGVKGQCPQGVPDVSQSGYLGHAMQLPTTGVAVGNLAATTASAGWVKSIPAVVCRDGQLIPSLAVQGLTALLGEAPMLVQAGGAQALVYQAAGMQLPLSAEGQYTIPFAVPNEAWVSVPAGLYMGNTAQVLPELAGKVVLVGSSAFGLADRVSTPLAQVQGGFVAQAQAMVGMLDGASPILLGYTAKQSGAIALATVAVAAGLSVLLILLANVVIARVLTKAGGVKQLVMREFVLQPAFALLGLAGLSVLLKPGVEAAAPALGLAPTGQPVFAGVSAGQLVLGVFALAYLLAEVVWLSVRYRRAYNLLGTFFSSSAAMAGGLQGGGALVHQSAVVAAVRLRNFNRQVASIEQPKAAMALLDDYYRRATNIAAEHGGVVLEFMGDTVLLGFANGKQADQAVGCGHAVEAAKALLEDGFLDKHACAENMTLTATIEEGECTLALIGEAARRANACVGQCVGTAIQLQDICDDHAQALCLGERAYRQYVQRGDKVSQLQTAQAARDVLPLGRFLLSHSQVPVEVFAIKPPAKWLARSAKGAEGEASALDISEIY